jgi:hypothetical protein
MHLTCMHATLFRPTCNFGGGFIAQSQVHACYTTYPEAPPDNRPDHPWSGLRDAEIETRARRNNQRGPGRRTLGFVKTEILPVTFRLSMVQEAMIKYAADGTGT